MGCNWLLFCVIKINPSSFSKLPCSIGDDRSLTLEASIRQLAKAKGSHVGAANLANMNLRQLREDLHGPYALGTTVGQDGRTDQRPHKPAAAHNLFLPGFVFVNPAQHQRLDEPIIIPRSMTLTISSADAGDTNQSTDTLGLHGGNQITRAFREQGHFLDRTRNRRTQGTDNGFLTC